MDIKNFTDMSNNELSLHILEIRKDLQYIKDKIDKIEHAYNSKFKEQDTLNQKFILFMNNVEFIFKLFLTFGGGTFLSFLLYLYLKQLW